MKTEQTPQHGEKALVQQIAELQKQLDECLDTGLELTRDRDLERRIYHAIHGLFLPTKVWSEHDKENRNHFVPWWYLRTFLFDCDLFNSHWSNPDFRKGVDMLNDIVLVVDSDHRPTTTEHMEKYELASRLFGYWEDRSQDRHRATQYLISALHIIRNNQDHPKIKNMVSDSDLVDMLVILKAISFFQRVWIEAKPV